LIKKPTSKKLKIKVQKLTSYKVDLHSNALYSNLRVKTVQKYIVHPQALLIC